MGGRIRIFGYNIPPIKLVVHIRTTNQLFCDCVIACHGREILLRLLPTVLAKCYRIHSNIDYFLAVIRMKMKLGYSMFSGLKISKTNKFLYFNCFHGNMKILFTIFGYMVMLRARMFRSLIIRTGIKERNIRALNITI